MNTKNWFTVEEIDADTFAVSEYKHWEETHCYLLRGTKTSLLIETGLGVSNIKDVVDELTDLPIQVATTHAHWDHIGGHKYFDNFVLHEAEKDWLSEKFSLPLEAVKQNLTRLPCNFPKNFSIDDYKIYQGTPRKTLHDGDCLNLGNRRLTAIHTPGHSPGHCCFYEQERGYLYSGNLVYKGCLDAFYPTTDPWIFWQPIKKIQALNVTRILPAHHQLSITVDIIVKIKNAFYCLNEQGRLEQGKGLFDFSSFQIYIIR